MLLSSVLYSLLRNDGLFQPKHGVTKFLWVCVYIYSTCIICDCPFSVSVYHSGMNTVKFVWLNELARLCVPVPTCQAAVSPRCRVNCRS